MKLASQSTILMSLAIFVCAASLTDVARAGAGNIGGVKIKPSGNVQNAQYRYGKRNLSRGELQYYCSKGSQTPFSLRRLCGRLGLGGWGRKRKYGNRRVRLTEQEAYYCSLGSQTPYSLRRKCARAGYGGFEVRRRNRRRVRPLARGRRLTTHELEYYCNKGDQTPYSVRSQCARRGIGGWGY